MTPPRREPSRRTLSLAATLMLSLTTVRLADGFVSTSPFSSMPVHGTRAYFPLSLHMTPKQQDFSKTRSIKTTRLPEKQQHKLLLQAIEYRRLCQLEKDMSMQNDNKLPLLSLRAKAAGYGEDLDSYETVLNQGHRARESLLTHNMGLVHYAVSDILGSHCQRKRLNSLSRDDLLQEGAIGLARAVDKYNPSLGTKFSTYAVYWIRAAILRCIAQHDDMLRVPQHVSEAISKVTRAATKLGLELDTNDEIGTSEAWKQAQNAKALAQEAGLTNPQFKQAMQVRRRRNQGGYTTFEPWMQRGTKQDDLMHQESVDNQQLLTSCLSRFLRPKEMEALSWRYGLNADGQVYRDYLAETEEELYGPLATDMASLPVRGKKGEAMSFSEVGKHMQVSAEYGRRLVHTALSKLRAAAKEGKLEPALLF